MPQAFNTFLWAAGLALHAALLLALLLRGTARHLPLFTGLIAFYLLRSAALFALSGHIDPRQFSTLADGFASLDPLLNLAVALELAAPLLRQSDTFTLRRMTLLLAILPVSATLGWAAGRLFPSRGHLSIDRFAVALAALFLLLSAFAIRLRTAPLIRRVLLGFAVYSAVGAAAQLGHYRAVQARGSAAYRGWSYTLDLAYLLVLALWLAAALRFPLTTGAVPAARIPPGLAQDPAPREDEKLPG